MGFDVARQARIRVDAPCSANPVLAIEDGEVAEPRLLEKDSERQTAWPCADDSHGRAFVIPFGSHRRHPIRSDCPPSMTSSAPVMKDACSEIRNATASAISNGVPNRPLAAMSRF